MTQQHDKPSPRVNPALKSLMKVLPATDSITLTPLTVDRLVQQTLTLLAILIPTAIASTYGFSFAPMAAPIVALVVGLGLVGYVWFMFANPQRIMSPIYAMIYAALEGIFLGASTYFYVFFGNSIPAAEGFSIIGQAVVVVVLTFAVLLFSYRKGWLKVGDKFLKVTALASVGALTFYLIAIVASFFVDTSALFVAGPLAIVVSLVMVVIASMNIAADIYYMDQAVQSRTDSRYGWGLSVGLIASLAWLYLEILRLLRNLYSR